MSLLANSLAYISNSAQYNTSIGYLQKSQFFLKSGHCLSSWIILVNLNLSGLRVTMGKLVHRETEDKQEPRSDLASTQLLA